MVRSGYGQREIVGRSWVPGWHIYWCRVAVSPYWPLICQTRNVYYRSIEERAPQSLAPARGTHVFQIFSRFFRYFRSSTFSHKYQRTLILEKIIAKASLQLGSELIAPWKENSGPLTHYHDCTCPIRPSLTVEYFSFCQKISQILKICKN